MGDINQSIYGFRGSNKDYFKELTEQFPDKFMEVHLSTNYRSTEQIIDLSQDFISSHHDGDLKPAICGTGKSNDIYFMVSEDKKSESENILEIIRYLKNKVKLSDIGILMRSLTSSSSCFNTLAKLLEENNINYHVGEPVIWPIMKI